MTLYDRIKKLRIEQNMSQEDLAFKVGYKGRSMIARIESGQVDISQSKVKAFAKALNTSIDYLMDGAGESGSMPTDDRFSKHQTAYTDPVDLDRLEALHQNPRLGLLFDHSTKMKPEDVDFMISMAERIIRERDADE